MATRIDYIQPAPKKKVGRPRLMNDGSSIESGSSSIPSMNPIEPSLDSSSNIEASSAQEQSSVSLGSATSAQDLHARMQLLTELKAARKAAENAEKAQKEAQKEREEMRKAAEKAKKETAKKDEKLKELKAALRRLTRKKKSAARGMTLTHSDGTTSRLHNVRNVFR